MRTLIRNLVHATTAAVALAAPSMAPAADTRDSSQRLGDLVKEAQEKLSAIRNELDQLDAALNRAQASPSAGLMGGAFSGGGRAEYSDLLRSTRDLTDIGNRVLSITSKCVEEARPIGVKFRSQSQRLQSSVNHIESASSAAMAQMAIDNIRRDVDVTEDQLQAVAGLAGSCGG